MSNLQFIGYHATTKKAYNNISKNEQFKESISNSIMNYRKSKYEYHWLGKGVYFWSNDIEMAKVWGERYGTLGRIIQVDIKYSLGECFNLERYDCRILVEEMVDAIMKQNHVKGFEDLRDKANRLYPLIGMAIDLLFEEFKFSHKLVYGTFRVPTKTFSILDRTTPQICVKDQEVIQFETLKCHKIEKNNKLVPIKMAHNKKSKSVNL